MSKKNKEVKNKEQEEPKQAGKTAESAKEEAGNEQEGKAPEVDEEANKIEEKLNTLLKENEELKASVAKEGTALIFNKLMGYLKTKGLEVIKAKGEKFDTDFHEAVAQFPVPEEDKKGLVYDVVQTGYTLSGKVIRYAKVVVGI